MERFIALNPCRKIPVLEDGDFKIAESAAIIAYLAESYGSRNCRLLPVGRLERARWTEWSFFIAMELDATALYVIRRHGGLPRIYGEAPAAVQSARTYFSTQLQHVDATLRAGGPFLMGDQFTTADILLTTCLTDAIMRDVPVYDSCYAYLERITSREAYRKALAANAAKSQHS